MRVNEVQRSSEIMNLTQHDNVLWFHADVIAKLFHCIWPEYVWFIGGCVLFEPGKTTFTTETIFDFICAPRTKAKEKKH